MAQALPVLWLNEKRLHIDIKNFKSVLSKVGNRSIAVISINGPSRTGKSYLLSLFIRYFESKKTDPGCTKWYNNASCADIERQIGIDRITAGINMWSEPYFVKKNNGEEIAVLLLDTQGLADLQTSVRHNVFISSFSTLLSSVMIFNSMQMIDEDLLQKLEFFSGYAHFTSGSQSKSINQDGNGKGEEKMRSIKSESSESSYKHRCHLQFLIRDFDSPEYAYGAHTRSSNPPGKKNLFEDLFLLQHHPDAAEEQKVVRENILRSFQDVSIYTLPDPKKDLKSRIGKTIAPDAEFRDNVISFVEYMVDEKNLVKKTVFDKPVSGVEFQKYIDSLNHMCENARVLFPELLKIADNTAFTQYSIALNLGVSKYQNDMDWYVREKLGSATPEELEAVHAKLKCEAESIFCKAEKMCHPKFEERFPNELETNIELCYELWKVSNNELKEVVEKCEENEEMMKAKLHNIDTRMAKGRIKVQGMVRGLNKISGNLQSDKKQFSIKTKEKLREYRRAMDRSQKEADELKKTIRELIQKTDAISEENAQTVEKNEIAMERKRKDNLKLQQRKEEWQYEIKKKASPYKMAMERNRKAIKKLEKTNQELTQATIEMRRENLKVMKKNYEAFKRIRQDSLAWKQKAEDLKFKRGIPAFLTYIFEVVTVWVPYNGNKENIPRNAFVGGNESGFTLFIARGTYKGDLLPGKLHSRDGILYVPWGGKSISLQGCEIEVLVARPGALKWKSMSNGAVDSNSIMGGQTVDGDKLYIGRTCQGNTIVGKIHQRHRKCFVANNGKEVSDAEYEVLCKV